MLYPQNIEEVKNFVGPSSATEGKSFVRLGSYYHQLVKNFHSIATHLTYYTKKKISFDWNEKCEERFQKLNSIDNHTYFSTGG